MNILFDQMSTQVQVQNEAGNRLNTLFCALTDRGWTYAQSTNPLTTAQLADYDVLCILTRLPFTQPGCTNPFPPETIFAYLPSEVDAILQFVSAGGGLLFISNHGPFPSQPADDQTRYDRTLANMLGVYMQPAEFQYPGKHPPPLIMSGPLLSSDPAIASTILDGVGSIVVHNSCAISALPGTTLIPIASIPSDASNLSPLCPGPTPAGQAYAATLSYGSGRVIVGGNSGIVGDPDSQWPAQGMIEKGDNKTFLLNCFSYLAPQA